MNFSTNDRRDIFVVFWIEKINVDDDVFSNFVTFNFEIFDFEKWRHDSNENVWRLFFEKNTIHQIYINFNIETNFFRFNIDEKKNFDFHVKSIAKFIINIDVFWKIDNKSNKRKSDENRRFRNDVCKKLSINKQNDNVCKKFSINK